MRILCVPRHLAHLLRLGGLVCFPVRHRLWLLLAGGCVFNFGSTHSQNNLSAGKTGKRDSLQRLLKSDFTDSARANNLIALAITFKNSADLDLAREAILSSISISEKNRDSIQLSKAYNVFGNICNKQNSYAEAVNYFNLAISIRKKAGLKGELSASYVNLGNSQMQLGNYPEALKSFLAALKIDEEEKNHSHASATYNSLGNFYFFQGEVAQSLKYYEKCLQVSKEQGNLKGEAGSYTNIGNLNYFDRKFREAIDNYLRALKLRADLNDKMEIAALHNNLGIVYEDLKMPDSALFHYLYSEKMNAGDMLGLSTTYINMGKFYFKNGRDPISKTYFNKSLDLALKMGSKEQIKNCLQNLFILDSVSGDYKSAYNHYKQFVLYGDSLANEESVKKTIQTQMQYDFDKKSAADSIKNTEAKKFEEIKHQQEISKQKTFACGGIAGFLVMIVVAGISFRAFKNKQKANVLIAQQKHLVEEKQKEILDSIYYARRIQRALITNEKYFTKNLNRLNKL